MRSEAAWGAVQCQNPSIVAKTIPGDAPGQLRGGVGPFGAVILLTKCSVSKGREGVVMWPPQSSWLWLLGAKRRCPCVGLGWVVEPAFP